VCGFGRESDGEAFARVPVSVCVRARVRMCTFRIHSLPHSDKFVFVCAFHWASPFCVCCVRLAVLGAVGGDLASSAHEWPLQRLGAFFAKRCIATVALGRCVLRLGTGVGKSILIATGFIIYT
jgi:hypothetical protein